MTRANIAPKNAVKVLLNNDTVKKATPTQTINVAEG